MKPETRWIEVSGSSPATLAMEVAGEGVPFLWSHALMGSMAQDLEGGVLAWRDLDDLCRVIRYDARGHGGSESIGEPRDFSWEQLAINLWEVADHCGEDSLVLGGASMGSATSLHAACLHPERVRALVLVIPPRVWEWREGKASGYRITAKIISATRAMPIRLLARLPFSKGGSFRKNSLGIMLRDLAGADPEGLAGAQRGAALSDLPPRDQLAALEIPTLILAWPNDATHPLEVAEELHRTLPNSRLEVAREDEDPWRWPEMVREFIGSLY